MESDFSDSETVSETVSTQEIIEKRQRRKRNDLVDEDEVVGKGYRRALLEIDEDKVVGAPEENWFIGECFPGRFLFCWFFPHVFRGFFKTISMQDLPRVVSHAETKYIEKKFDYIWPKLKGWPLRLVMAMNYCFGVEFWLAGIVQVITTACQVFVPKLMQLFLEQLFKPYDKDVPEILENMEQLREILPTSHEIYPPPDDDIVRTNNWEAWLYLGLLCVCYWIALWGLQYSFHLSGRVGMKIRTLVVSKVYQKSLRLSNKARGKYENGVIMNHVTTDAVKFERVHTMFHYGWTGWLLLFGSLPFLIDLIDFGALTGIFTNLLIIPVCVFVISIFIVIRIIIVKVTDLRVNKTNEVLQSIRIVKFFAWEDSFLKRILKIRFFEIILVRMTFSLFAVLIAFFLSLTNIVCFVAFLTFFFVHGYLDSIKVFTALTYFNSMRAPLTMAPMIIIMVLEMLISFGRIRKLLEEEELEVVENSDNEEFPIIIEGGTFRWEVPKKKKDSRSPQEIKKERMKKIIKKICCCACAPLLHKDVDSDYALPEKDYSNDEREDGQEKKEDGQNEEFDGRVSSMKQKFTQLLSKIPIIKKKIIKKKEKKIIIHDEEISGEEEDKKKDLVVNLGYLEDINLRVKKGSLVVVVGKVGSGKSSLLYAILGEMKRYEGNIKVQRSFAFTSQLSWIQNATLFDNVTFGEDEDEEKWEKVVKCCQLTQDLQELKGGRNIEIGEKGINLSGGQKYRVQLARACYSTREVVLLDDPLAAVDAHVGKKIFFDCIMDYLKGRTRILVTHQLQYLQYADHVVLMEEGKIREQGKYEDLIEKNGAMASLVSDYNATLEEEEEEEEIRDGSDFDSDGISTSKKEEEEEEGEEEEIKQKQEDDSKSDNEEEEGGETIEIVVQEEDKDESEEDKDDSEDEKGSLDSIIKKSKLESVVNSQRRKKEAEKKRKMKNRNAARNRNSEEENKIIQSEEMSSGIISPKVVITYICNMGCYGIVPLICIFVVFLNAQLVTVGTDWWLSEWSNGGFNEEFSKDYHLHVYVKSFDGGSPVIAYLDTDDDDYSTNVPPVVDTKNVTSIFQNFTITMVNSTDNSTYNVTYSTYNETYVSYPPIIKGMIDCSSQKKKSESSGSNSFSANLPTIKKVPTDYICPSPIGWCGCNDFFLPVMWIKGYDNGTKIEDGLKQTDSLYVYAGFGFSALFFMFVRTVVALNFLITAGHTLHNKALRRVFKAPMSFFDTTPIGRIVARFSTDTTLLDSELIMTAMPAMSLSFAVGGMFFIICYNTNGWGALFVAPLGIVYALIYIFYRKTNMELKRLESVSKTPMLSHISETLSGMPTIRAYEAKPRFIDRVQKLIDHNNRAFYMLTSAQRWLGVQLGIFGSVFMFSIGSFLILINYYWDAVELEVSYTALALSYSILATQLFFMVVDNLCEAEIKMNSVERLDFYCKHIPIEAPFDSDLRKPKNFVRKGTIEFKNYSMRYRKGLELVLKDLSIKIRPFERIGIVGRTGSGKSSLMIALWRIVEAARGRIFIDGYGIDELNLIQLRNCLSIIPQDATLFSGTIRSNLDPFSDFKDGEIWKALEQSYMKDKVMSLKGKLNGVMKEGGSNFSVGERQLFCLGRALLRNTKILVLDEATASVDVATDAKIQKTIRDSFKNCTSLTIAHRLETIIDCDRILVMDDGYAAEFDTPKNLLENTEDYSIFRDLVRETGDGTEGFLYDVAFGRKQLDYDDMLAKKDEKKEEVEGEEEEESLNDDDGSSNDDDDGDDDDDDDSGSGDTEEEDDES